MQSHLFLIGTHAGLFRVVLDPNLDVVSCERLRPGHHYAISVRPEAGLIYSKNRDEFLNVLRAADLEKVDELTFDPVPAQVHQALMVDGGVFLTDTFNNRITYQDITGASIQCAIDGHDTDVNHVNSLFLRSGGVTAMLHNLGNGGSELLDLDFDRTRGFTVRHRRRLDDTGCHNIFLDGDHCLFNASNAGDFVVRDLRTDIDVRRVTFGGHSKGLSVLGDRVVIGVSENASQAERGRCASSLAFLDRDGYRVIKLVPLRDTKSQNPIGNINEIRCLSHPDYSEGSASIAPMALPKPTFSRRLAGAMRSLRRR